MKNELKELVLDLQSRGLTDASLLAAKLYKKAQAIEEEDAANPFGESMSDMFDDTDAEQTEDMYTNYDTSCMYLSEVLVSAFELNTIEAEETFVDEVMGMCQRHEPPEDFITELATFLKALMEEE